MIGCCPAAARARLRAFVAERAQADVAGAVAHQHQHGEAATPSTCRPAPARRASHSCSVLRQARQKQQLSRCSAGREHADHKAPPCDEPARGDGGAEHQGGHAGADADHDAPQQHQSCQTLVIKSEPKAGTTTSCAASVTTRRPKRFMNAAAKGPISRTGETDRQRGGDFRVAPAEFLLQRHDSAGGADRAGRDQHGQEGDGDHHPAIMDVLAGERGGEPVRDHGASEFQ